MFANFYLPLTGSTNLDSEPQTKRILPPLAEPLGSLTPIHKIINDAQALSSALYNFMGGGYLAC